MTHFRRQHYCLLFIALVGALIVLVPASYYTRIADDGFNYVSPARSLLRGEGFVDYGGGPYVKWAPLYPALLAFVALIFKMDPLPVSYLLNALTFGVVVYLAGVLALKHFASFSVALFAALAILASAPLFEVSNQAWSEPIFIVLVILSFMFLHIYVERNDSASLLYFSLTVALACTQRYVGISLIIWGGLMLIFIHRCDLGTMMRRSLAFASIASLPLAAWMIRNAVVGSGTFATREPPQFTFWENLTLAYEAISYWVAPGLLGELGSGFLLVCIAITGLALLKTKTLADRYLVLFISGALFCVIFVIFVSTSCALTQCLSPGKVNSRTFSPVYVPLVLLALISVETLRPTYVQRVARVARNLAILALFSIWLSYQGRADVAHVEELIHTAQPLRTAKWRESEMVHYLVRHPGFGSACKADSRIYTNDVVATFVLAGLSPDRSLNGFENSTWPPADRACLIWYDAPSGLDWFPWGLTYYPLEKLQDTVDVHPLVRLRDGTIYLITRK